MFRKLSINAEEREVAEVWRGGVGKRPDMLQYKQDIAELAKQGATLFHAFKNVGAIHFF